MEAQIKVVLLVASSLLWSCGSNDRDLKPTRRPEPDLDTRTNSVRGVGRLMRHGDDMSFVAWTGFDMIAYIPNYYRLDSAGIDFKSLLIPSGDTVTLGSVVDTATFRVMGLTEAERRGIRNPYYLDGRMNCYYVDVHHVYAYHGHPPFSFRLIGSREDMELLGGDYLKLGQEVYSMGRLILDADVKSFRTIDVSQLHRKTSWELTIGLDVHNSYSGPHVMSERSFDEVFNGAEDSLRRAYFGPAQDRTERRIH